MPSSLEKTLMLGKVERKRRTGQPVARWMDLVTVTLSATLEELKESDYHEENISMWSKNQQ